MAGILEGIKVVDMGHVVAVPAAGAMLAHEDGSRIGRSLRAGGDVVVISDTPGPGR